MRSVFGLYGRTSSSQVHLHYSLRSAVVKKEQISIQDIFTTFVCKKQQVASHRKRLKFKYKDLNIITDRAL